MNVAQPEEPKEGEAISWNRPHQKQKRPWYKSPVIYVLGTVPVATFALGVWQIRRLEWKVNLINEIDDQLRQAPLQLPRNVK